MDPKLKAYLDRLEAEDAGTYHVPDDPAWKQQTEALRPADAAWSGFAGTSGGMMQPMPESRGQDMGIMAPTPPTPQGRMAGSSSDAELMRLLKQMGIQ